MAKLLYLLMVIVLGGTAYLGFKLYEFPKNEYSQIINGQPSRFFTHQRYSQKWLMPIEKKSLPLDKKSAEYWRYFQISNAEIPLPVRHPMINTSPIFEGLKENGNPYLGLKFSNPEGRELGRILIFKNSKFKLSLSQQFIFQLPLVQKYVTSLSSSKWLEDLFSLDLTKVDTNSIEQMIYAIFLLDLRSQFFPADFIIASWDNQNNRLIFEIENTNKDFDLEYILIPEGDTFTTFLLSTRKENLEAKSIRHRLLTSFKYRSSSTELSQIIYREFKALPFKQQIDQEGMLYLFASWSHQIEKQGLFQEMIFFLERGNGNKEQLKPLYEYSYQKYGKTFSTKDIGLEDIDSKIKLQMQIEWEERKKGQDEVKVVEEIRPVDEKSLSPEARREYFLQKIKNEKNKNKTKIKFD